MGRQARREWQIRECSEQAAGNDEPPECWLCGRRLGRRTEWHHPQPKSRGGRVTVPVHPICHRAIHANFDNAELDRMAANGMAPNREARMQRFLDWIAGKDPDFHAPTRERR